MPADQKDITIGFFMANKAQDAELDLTRKIHKKRRTLLNPLI